jgi:hypothetical protein
VLIDPITGVRGSKSGCEDRGIFQLNMEPDDGSSVDDA